MPINDLIEQECYKALRKIKAVIQDDNLDDPECFMKIEKNYSCFRINWK